MILLSRIRTVIVDSKFALSWEKYIVIGPKMLANFYPFLDKMKMKTNSLEVYCIVYLFVDVYMSAYSSKCWLIISTEF